MKMTPIQAVERQAVAHQQAIQKKIAKAERQAARLKINYKRFTSWLRALPKWVMEDKLTSRPVSLHATGQFGPLDRILDYRGSKISLQKWLDTFPPQPIVIKHQNNAIVARPVKTGKHQPLYLLRPMYQDAVTSVAWVTLINNEASTITYQFKSEIEAMEAIQDRQSLQDPIREIDYVFVHHIIYWKRTE